MGDNHEAKKIKLILAVSGCSLVIVIIWIMTLPLSWPKKGESLSWPEFNVQADSGFESLKQRLDNLMDNNQDEGTVEADRQVLSNPEQLSDEEIKQIEENIFPKEKNNAEEQN